MQNPHPAPSPPRVASAVSMVVPVVPVVNVAPWASSILGPAAATGSAASVIQSPSRRAVDWTSAPTEGGRKKRPAWAQGGAKQRVATASSSNRMVNNCRRNSWRVLDGLSAQEFVGMFCRPQRGSFWEDLSRSFGILTGYIEWMWLMWLMWGA
jgi:hypothetical protein